MYLHNIKLWNFRKFGSLQKEDSSKPDLDLNFTKGLNVLIGENDSGKTAIVDAIKLVLKTHSYEWLRITHNDFYENSLKLRIELVFKDLKDSEAKNFTEWLGWEEIEIENQGAIEKVQAPYLRLILDSTRNNESILPSEVRAGVDDTGYQLSPEAKEYLKVTYLKPLRDAEGELVPRKNSRLSQILLGHDAFKDKDDNHMLLELFKDFNKSVENYFEGKDKDEKPLEGKDADGKKLKDEIDGFIQTFYSANKESNFGIVEGKLKNILEKLELTLKNERNPGLGTLNRLFISSELLHLHKYNWDGLRLGLIEELEAHLHPQAQMRIIEALQKETDVQLILTTHSPNLGSKVKLENLILCNSNSAFPLGANYTELEKDDYLFLERFLDVTKANLFYAKGVIIVEGWSEEILLPSIVNKLKQHGTLKNNLTEAGVSIVNVGSTAYFRYSRIFLRKSTTEILNIPVSIITDVDVPAYSKREKLDDNGDVIKNEKGKVIFECIKEIEADFIKKTEAKRKGIEEKHNNQKVKVFVSPKWTLEYSLLMSSSFSELFCKALKKIHPNVDESNYESELAKKLLSKSLKKPEIAYQLAELIDSSSELVIDEKDENIKFIIDALKYVCNG